jgi:hypothetical protein
VRWTVWLTLGLALGAILWLVVAPRTPSDPYDGEEPSPSSEDPAWTRLKSGTLTLSVHGSDGLLPVGAQVGFETPRGPRLYYVDARGVRTLTDVPLGDVVIVAEAPGYERVRRPTRVEAGVPGELRLLLEPEPKTGAPGR